MIGLCLTMVLVGWCIGWPMSRMAVLWAERFGLLDKPGSESHKEAKPAVPNIGGIALFWAVALPIGVIVGAVWAVPMRWWASVAPAILEHLPGLRDSTVIGGWLLGGLAAIHLVGLLDDRKPMPVLLKLLAQVIVACGLAIGADTRVLELLDHWGLWGYALSVTVTVLWVVAMTNAFNMLDNMDGLSAGVASVVSAVYLSATMLNGQWFVAGNVALLLGALLGFLWFNRPPARLYMGDGGSLVVGLLLAVVSIRTTYFYDDPTQVFSEMNQTTAWWGLFMPVVVMAVPLYDLVSVSILRLREGRSPLSGDRNHFSHRLVKLGLSRGYAVLVIVLATAATGISGIMLPRLEAWQACLVLLQCGAVVATLAVLEWAGAQKWRVKSEP